MLSLQVRLDQVIESETFLLWFSESHFLHSNLFNNKQIQVQALFHKIKLWLILCTIAQLHNCWAVIEQKIYYALFWSVAEQNGPKMSSRGRSCSHMRRSRGCFWGSHIFNRRNVAITKDALHPFHFLDVKETFIIHQEQLAKFQL